MSLDLQDIKARADLTKLFREDGHELRRAGANWFCHCPFHEEKSGSCKVDEERFKCFGCGASGDVFDYWERSRGSTKRDAIEELARYVGLAPDIDGFHKPAPKPRPRPKKRDEIIPLDADQTKEWLDAVERLKESPESIARIARWRGFKVETVRWAVEQGIIGLRSWSGVLREAFLVEAPEARSGPLVPVSVHIRLGPETRGNPHPKQSWRFDPAGRGSWPIIMGDLPSAQHTFLLEGQWDALALVDLMEWHRRWPDRLAVVGMRGATSFEKLLKHYAFHEKSTVFAIADADLAGSKWFEPDGFIDRLRPQVARLFSFWPGESGLDLNDLLQRGLRREHMEQVLRPKLRHPRYATLPGPTFLTWCKNHAEAPEAIGRAARFVIADKSRPRGRQALKTWVRHWRKLGISAELEADLHIAWDTWKNECRSPSKAA